MKRMLLLPLLFVATSFYNHLNAQITETATDAVKNMGVGWNLGNTLDASTPAGNYSQSSYWGAQGLESETYWGQPLATPELFAMMKNAGYGAIRVPVTWYNHMDANGNVKAEWMKRVRTVVDHVLKAGLYCIINVHHDTGADNDKHQSWLKADLYSQNKDRYEHLWKQIAQEFKDYDGHLLFESYNEMLDTKSSWCFASYNTPTRYDATLARNSYDGINGYAQSFVNVVRATGGNNATRNLVVNTYAAANGSGTWNTHLQDPLKEMKLPEDNEKGHLIFEIHTYPQIATKNAQGKVENRKMEDIRKEIDDNIAHLKNHLVAKGAPVIIGEWGTSNVDAGDGKTDYDVRPDHMKLFIEYFVKQTKAAGMAAFYWMGITDGFYRSMPAFSQPDLAECMIKAYHGSDFKGEYPTPQAASAISCFEGEKVLGWGNGITIAGALFKSIGASGQLELTYKHTKNVDDIQFFYGDWSTKPPFMADGKKYDGDLIPHSHYSSPLGSEHTTIFTFDDAVYEHLCKKGLIIHGDGITIYKAQLTNPASAIALPTVTPHADDACYTLSGQRIAQPSHGIFIRGGKKVVVR